MKKTASGLSALFLFIGLYLTSPVFAGQVVTKELSQWANQAIANEEALPAVSSAKSIAVLYFQNLTTDPSYDPLQKGMSIMLTNDLSKIKDLKVVDRARLQALLEQIEVDTETVPRIGRLLGARFLSSGDILKGTVTQLKVDPNLLDVLDKTTVSQPAAEGNLNDLIAIEKEILFEIVRLMDITLTPAQKVELEKPMSTSVPALMLFFKGVDASDNGKYSEAADLYKQALAKDPDLSMAKDAVKEIKALDLLPKAAEAAPKELSPLLKWSAIGLGVAAVGVGSYFAADAISGSDDDEPPPPPPDTSQPMVTRTTPRAGSDVNCSSGFVEFHFSEAMNPSAGQVTAVDSSWAVSTTYWKDEVLTLIMEWVNDDEFCSAEYPDDGGRITFQLTGFTDEKGNALSGEKRFTYIVTQATPAIPEDTDSPTVLRTAPRSGSSIVCSSGNIEFHFSEPMDTSVGVVDPDGNSTWWTITKYSWIDEGATLLIDWDNASADCSAGSGKVKFELSGFADEAGNGLDGETIFLYLY